MNKRLTTVIASTAGVGLLLASTSAKAFVPVVLAAIIGGSVLGGAVLGGAATSSAYHNSPAVVATAPGVTVGSTSCYFKNRLANPVTQTWVRERVCTTDVP